MKTLSITLLISLLIFGCSSSKNKASSEQIQALEQLVTDREFIIESNWALPMTTNALVSLQNAGLFAPGDSASRISLMGNPNYLKIKGDSVWSQLPYFGERQMVGSYSNNDAGINLKSLITDYKLTKNDKKNYYTLIFRAESESEGFKVYINLFPNGNSSISINGNNRFPIEYTGQVKDLD